ncbi:MAG: hypothetical protein U9R37_08710 [Campylobacterota bacterium]|nr:hypothetical protein [Campylobacterota bacterium]
MIENISFQDNGFLHKAINFDNKKMVLYVNRFKNDKFIDKIELRMGQIPKSVKKQLNPLKIKSATK